MQSADCVIVGAGLAGAATAYALSRRGLHDVILVEREAMAGFHASGRNAAMVRHFVSDEALQPLALEGAHFIRTAHERWRQGRVFHPGGSFFVASGRRWSALRHELELARKVGLEAETWEPEEVFRRVDATRGGSFDGAVYTPDDGTADVHALLRGFLREATDAGARLLVRSPVHSISVDAAGCVEGVRAGDVEIATRRVVNAGGAWAGEVARLSGACPIPFTPFRRHLVYTGPYAAADPDWPYVWDLDCDLYFRPESSGLLLSPCDEEAAVPGVPGPDPVALELLHAKLHRSFPALADLPIARSWAGLRTFAPDRRFVLGRDPQVEGFYWAAGLGGHGVTTSAAVGAWVAREMLGSETPQPHPFSPSRYAT